MKLIQLDDGKWIDPETVTLVAAFWGGGVGKLEPGAVRLPPYVSVVHGSGAAVCTIPCEVYYRAQELANALAKRVNDECAMRAIHAAVAKSTAPTDTGSEAP